MGLGTVSLWPLDDTCRHRLGVGTGYVLGTCLGQLATLKFLLWLGSAAAFRVVGVRSRLLLQHRLGRCEF